MRTFFRKLNLTFHGEGASSGGEGGEGASGEGAGNGMAADAGQMTLESLGVPKSGAEKFRAIKARRSQQRVSAEEAETSVTGPRAGGEHGDDAGQDAAAQQGNDENTTQQSRRTFSNEDVESIVQKRIAKAKSDNESMRAELERMRAERETLEPALKRLAQQFGGFGEDGKIDIGKLNDAIRHEPQFYQDVARKLGTTRENAMKITLQEEDEKQREEQAKKTAKNQMVQAHFAGLRQQAEELKKTYPDFNLEEELQNEVFFQATAPGSKMTLKQAYQAVHGDELLQRQTQATARAVNDAAARRMQSGRNIPQENGTVRRSPATIQQKMYHEMSQDERKLWLEKVRGTK